MRKGPPKYIDESKHPKPAFRVKYEEYLEEELRESIHQQADSLRQKVEDLLLAVSLDAYLEGWMDGGGESPYLTGSGIRLDPRVPGGIASPPEKE